MSAGGRETRRAVGARSHPVAKVRGVGKVGMQIPRIVDRPANGACDERPDVTPQWASCPALPQRCPYRPDASVPSACLSGLSNTSRRDGRARPASDYGVEIPQVARVVHHEQEEASPLRPAAPLRSIRTHHSVHRARSSSARQPGTGRAWRRAPTTEPRRGRHG